MNKISKIFTKPDDNRYIGDIQNIVDKYHNTYHSSIKMTPTDESSIVIYTTNDVMKC